MSSLTKASELDFAGIKSTISLCFSISRAVAAPTAAIRIGPRHRMSLKAL